MAEEIVDQLHNEFIDIIAYLESSGELSLRNIAEEYLRKALLLAAASYFEQRITDHILSFVDESAQNNPLVYGLIQNKAVSRQYHTLFNWKAKNANQFFGLFGETYSDFMKEKVKNDSQLDQSIKAFLELGNERNELVHKDFGNFLMSKSTNEIYQLYQTALYFVDALPDTWRRCLHQTQQEAPHAPAQS